MAPPDVSNFETAPLRDLNRSVAKHTRYAALSNKSVHKMLILSKQNASKYRGAVGHTRVFR